MSLCAAVVRELVNAGLSGDALIDACARIEAAAPATIDAQAERRRAADRERKAQERLRKSAESAEQSLSPKERSPTPPKEITPIPETSLRSVSGAPAKPTPRTILLSVLTPNIADAVLEHRQKLRKPLTVLAAEGLVKGFQSTGDPNGAARMMVERGWQGFKLEWWENDNRKATGGTGQLARRGGLADFAASLFGVPQVRA
ncbi:MAG: hypothetical protein ACRCXM_11530, partial [Beijerinckiaceae bacterium]